MSATMNYTKLEQLTAEIRETETKHSQRMTELRQQLRAFADSFGTDAAPMSTPAPKSGRRGRPVGSKNRKNGSTAPAATKAPAKVRAEAKEGDRRKKGEQGLKKTIWDTLTSHPNGLTIGELREAVSKSGTWSSDAKNVDQQYASHISALKKDGKIVRTDDRKYQVVSGATL